MTTVPATDERLRALRQAGAARLDPVLWHYIEELNTRAGTQTGSTRALLNDKLHRVLTEFETRLRLQAIATRQPTDTSNAKPMPSPMAVLLQEMVPAADTAPTAPRHTATGWPKESARVRQFRRQLRKISVQKQVSQAIAQAPQNAGPINSHMLVLRALGLMQGISPDYLNRFMTHADTLLCLEDAERLRMSSRKAAPLPRSGKKKTTS